MKNRNIKIGAIPNKELDIKLAVNAFITLAREQLKTEKRSKK